MRENGERPPSGMGVEAERKQSSRKVEGVIGVQASMRRAVLLALRVNRAFQVQ